MIFNTVLITTSGLGERLKNLTKYTNKSLIKVGDKFGICYIIENYGIDSEFVITLGYYGDYVKDFLLLAYPNYNFIFVDIDLFYGPGSSLGYSMLKAKEYLQKPFIFHCCDSIIIDKIKFEMHKNTLCVISMNNSMQYTNVKVKQDQISQVNDKNYHDYDYIYTGICYIHDFNLFWTNLNYLYNQNQNDSHLNDIGSIKKMITDNNVKFSYIVLDNWFDTGNLDSYYKVNQIFKPKYLVMEKDYESLCFLENKVIKFINDKSINHKRVLRGENLYPLSPKIVDFKDNFICMELIDGQILSKSYQKGIIYKLLIWAKQNLWVNQIKKEEFKQSCINFYIKKTLDRIEKIKFLNNEKNKINGLECTNIFTLIKNIPLKLFINDTFSKFHGDFILDNIIKTEDSFKLIDWRHEFDDNIYFGDIYYDLAKLRHNIIFNHSNIINNLYTIYHINDEVIVDLKCNYFLIQQLDDFEKFVNENHFDLNNIKLITSLIWLNMAPLYEDKLSEFLFYFGKYNLSILTLNEAI